MSEESIEALINYTSIELNREKEADLEQCDNRLEKRHSLGALGPSRGKARGVQRAHARPVR
jgi:hypothetical protein